MERFINWNQVEMLSNWGDEKKFYKIGNGDYDLGISSKGVYLRYFELEILIELIQYRLLNTNQLRYLYEYSEPIKRDTFKKKLHRWTRRKLIKKVEVDMKQGFGRELDVYRIGKEGVKILVEEDLLSDEALNFNLTKYGKIRNIDHLLATNQVVMATKKEILEYEIVTPELANYRNMVNKEFGIITDAILKINNALIYFEIDMGTEHLPMLKEKLQRYSQMANHEKDYIHIVIISLLDKSYRTRRYYTNTGDRRRANIKNELMYETAILNSKLRPLVAHFKQTPYIVFPTIFNSFENEIDKNLKFFVNLMERKENVVLTQLDENLIYSRDVLQEHRNHFTFYKVENKAGTQIDVIAVMLIDNYNLIHDIVFKNMVKYVQKDKLLLNITKIIGIYDKKEDRESDKHGIVYPRNVMFTDFDHLDDNQDERFFISKTTYKTQKVAYLDC